MNPNSSSPHVRFTCRAVRQWSALTGGAASPHATSCPDCQEFFGAAAAFETALRRDAAHSQPIVSTGFERRILDAVRAADAEAASASADRGFKPLVPALAGGLAVAALVVVMLWINTASARRDVVSVSDARVVVRAVQSMSTQLVGSVLPSTGEFVAKNPLQQEVDSLYADARSALGFLAMNFLPAQPEQPRPSSG
jgi:hypothetical protein